MRRPLTLLVALMLAFGLLATTSLVGTSRVSAATLAAATSCSNGVDTTPGLGLVCEVTVVNRLTATGGSARVTVRECHGAAGPTQAACTTQTTVLTQPVVSVTQCNGSISSGGTLRCSVRVINNFVGVDPTPTAATINQCVGSGDGETSGCDPFPALDSPAMITQCNGSANGGTLVGLTCRGVGTQSPAFAVTINQCNGSANGGGSLVICVANVSNNIVAAPTPGPTATPGSGATATPGGGGGGGATPPSTDAVAEPGAQPGAINSLLLAGLLFLGALSLLFVVSEKGRSPKG